MKKIRDNKGITLIVLIITIIVLLIIAGISINMGITGIEESSDNRLLTELEKVQHAITERYTKYKLTKDDSILVGTKIETSSLTNVPSEIKWKVIEFADKSNKEREYYRLSTSNLNELGLTGGNDEYKGSSYIVNYYSGEVYDEGQKQTSKGDALYKSAIQEEVSELGDEYIKDDLQVWYDAINNIGTGHSSSTTTWKDLSGNGNDAKITTTGSSLNWQNNCLATNKAETITTPWTFSTSHTISVVFETLEFYNYNTIWEDEIRLDNNEAWTYENGILAARSQFGTGFPIYMNIMLNKKIKLDLVVDNENQNCYSYINGQLINMRGKVDLSGGKLIFNGGVNNSFGKNNYYSMKVYNRALSAEEIHHNYILDKARYGIEE